MHVSLCLTKKRKRHVNGGRCRLTWLKRCGSTVSGRALVRPDSCQTDREIVKTIKNRKRLWGGRGHRFKVPVRYLGGSPVDPAFAVGVDVEQHQTFHQIREDQLKSNELRR